MKTANKQVPYTPTHPGEAIKDEIEYKGISQKTTIRADRNFLHDA